MKTAEYQDLFTQRVLQDIYRGIPHGRNGFGSLEAFICCFVEWRAEPCTEHQAYYQLLCLHDPDGDFEPDNCYLLNVDCQHEDETLGSIYGKVVERRVEL